MSLEILMQGERKLHNEENNDISNGYKISRKSGRGKILEYRVPYTIRIFYLSYWAYSRKKKKSVAGLPLVYMKQTQLRSR